MAKNKAQSQEAESATKSAESTAQKHSQVNKAANAKAADVKGSGKKSAAKAQDKKVHAQPKAGIGEKAHQLKEFFEESKVELKKVTWPSRKETISTSIAVVVLTIVMSLFLWIVDLGLSKIVAFILS